jgi:hypothetical protein
MKTNTHFSSYIAHFFLGREMFQTKVVEKFKTSILCLITFFRNSCRLWDNVEKYCGVEQATDDRIGCWTPTSTNTHSEYVILIAFSLQQWLRERAWMLHCLSCLQSMIATWQTPDLMKRKWHLPYCPEVMYGKNIFQNYAHFVIVILL